MKEALIALATFILGFAGGFWISLYLTGKNIGSIVYGYLAQRVIDELDKTKNEQIKTNDTVLPSNGNPPPPPKP